MQRRTDWAKDLLRSSDLTLNAIALACGFADQSTLQWCSRGRSTSVPARGDVCAGRGLLQRLRRLQYLLGVARHLHLPPNAADHALVVDQEGGTLDAHVFLPI